MPPALLSAHQTSRPQTSSLTGAVQVSSLRTVSRPLVTNSSWIAQKAANDSSWPTPMPQHGDHRPDQALADHHAQQGQQRPAADPGLDAVPTAGDDGPGQGGRRAPRQPNEARASTA